MRLKRNENLQDKFDRLIDKIFLLFIPYKVKPNHVTLIRFILIPVIFWMLSNNRLVLALVVFVIAACTDFIDGAMARTRDQITDLGKVIDPIADKLLIMTALYYVGFDYLVVKIVAVFIVFEMVAVVLGYYFSFILGKPIGANVFGKVKLVLQCVSVGLFVLGKIISSTILVNLSLFLIFVALLFAVLAGIKTFKQKFSSINLLNKIF